MRSATFNTVQLFEQDYFGNPEAPAVATGVEFEARAAHGTCLVRREGETFTGCYVPADPAKPAADITPACARIAFDCFAQMMNEVA